jgi:PAS domain S-box-containing protein
MTSFFDRIRRAASFRGRRGRINTDRAFLAAIVESSDDAIITKNLDGIIQSCNAAAERIYGYSAAELIGQPINILIPAERQNEEVEILARIRRGERVEHFETVRLAKGRRLVEVSLTISPVRDDRGRIIAASNVARDITDRRRADAALRRAQQESRFLANASVALTDLSDSRTILQRAASLAVPFFADWCVADLLVEGSIERLAVVHGDAPRAERAQEVSRRWLPDARDLLGPGWVAQTGRAEMMEDASDGTRISWVRDAEHERALLELGFVSYISVPVSWGRGARAALTFVSGERRYEANDLRVAEDLAQRTAVAIENSELYQAALEADRRKDDFLAMLSHELRTPLNAIVGWSHVLREGSPSPDTLRKGVETIHRNALIQTQLISDILDISRIVAGKLRLDVGLVELPAVIEAAFDALRPAAEARQVRLETLVDPQARSFVGDADRLQQVVWNLVSNAIKFVPERVGLVQVRLEDAGQRVRLVVEDNGPGIDPAFLPHVFERFRQAESSDSRRYQGLGLGLAIVRQLVELHGGTVRVENRSEPSGAIFTVELPRRTALARVGVSEIAERRRRADEQAAWLDKAPSLLGVRILVVDDQADARELLKLVLERCGAQVVLAASAAEALEMVSGERPDLLLSDLEMPEQSGYDLIRQLRALPADRGGRTPAVALTAYASAHDRMKVLRAGFLTHVPKPVEPAELATVVASVARKNID